MVDTISNVMKPKLTIISCTVRQEGLDMLTKCLNQQTFRDFEQIVITNRFDIWTKETKFTYPLTIMWDPKKNEGDYYNLHKAWNHAIRQAKGELIVSIVDLTWIRADCLQKLWDAYMANPKSCITCIGHQYKKVIDGRIKSG